MIARFRSWWKKAKKPLEIFIVTGSFLALIALVVFIILTYIYNWNVPGLRGKNLWDWLQLLIIPVVLAVGGYLFNYTTSRNEQRAAQLRAQTDRDISLDNQREAALQEYFDKMSELLLEKKLRESGENDEVRIIAQVRTLTVLPRLDGKRKGTVLQFLYAASLINKNKRIVDLSKADLEDTFIIRANLSGANLYGANLEGANLKAALLEIASLFEANLEIANLCGANLRDAMIEDDEVWIETHSLKGATMPDGTKHAWR
jgi:hypothetical protein